MQHSLKLGLMTGCVATLFGGFSADAQFARPSGPTVPVSRDQPVFYTADTAQYDRDAQLVTLSGHVEIWQGERILRADTVTYDRKTGVAAGHGHVVIVDPSGQVLFSDYAELSAGMKNGILTKFSAQLAENGRLAANGARRTEGKINELSRAIYTTCNVCKKHPDQPPLWDIRARTAVQDLENKNIEYRDAVVDIYGVPIAYFPFLTHADPSQKRASGFLVPGIGASSHLGAFAQLPYYVVIDGQSDAILTPILATKAGPVLDVNYRRRFNNGTVTVDGSVGYDQKALQGNVFTKGQFTIDDEWRYGFDINRASSTSYLRDFKEGAIGDVLASSVYLEGFGQGSYTKLDARAYQGLSTSIVGAKLPYVLPRYQYSFVGQPDALGGRLSLDTGGFNVLRQQGTNTQRASLQGNWERPYNGALGDLWKLVLHVDSAAYNATALNQEPSYGPVNHADSTQAMPTVAVDLHWPFQRDDGWGGTQVLEPIVQLIGAPNGPSYGLGRRTDGSYYINSTVPNEDSLGLEFTDSNLFSLNRFPGIDRLEGGNRAAAALHGAWYFGGGQQLDALIGQAYRQRADKAFPVGSGLDRTISDLVGHVSFTPNKYLDLTVRGRLDHRNYDVRFADALASAGPSWLRLNAGYIYSSINPYNYYDRVPTGIFPQTPRSEITVGGSTTIATNYHLNASAQRNLQTGRMIGLGGGASYEDECFIFSAGYYRRYTSVNYDSGSTAVLFQLTFKTVGTFGFHAL